MSVGQLVVHERCGGSWALGQNPFLCGVAADPRAFQGSAVHDEQRYTKSKSPLTRRRQVLLGWQAFTVSLILSQWSDDARAVGPYDSSRGDTYKIAYPTADVSYAQGDAILSALEGKGRLNEEQIRELLPQLLQSHGVESERIAGIGVGADRFFILCSQCKDFCRGRCISHSGWGNHCFCWEPPSDVQRDIIILLLAEPEDETLALVAAVGSLLCQSPPPGMVAWYPGDDCTPSDLLGQHHGAFVGFPVCPVHWKVGAGALAFFSSPPTYVVVGDHPDLNFGTGDFSIDLWIKTASTTPLPGVQPILDKRTASPLVGYHLALFNGYLLAQLADGIGSGATNYFSTTNPELFIADGRWHFVAVTVNRDNLHGGLTLYVDNHSGAFNPSGRQGSLSNSADLRIGARNPSLGEAYFDGVMDEIEFFNRALTPLEVQAIYQTNSGGKCKCQPLPDGSACRNVVCPTANETCKPIEMVRDPSTGQTTVTECDCLNADQCSLVFGNHGLLFCDGVICPTAGVTCPLAAIGTPNPDGSTTFDCCRGEPPREEACCLPDGSCANLPVGDCTNRGGTPLGPGTLCTTPEACCDRGGACVFRDPLCCAPSFSPEGPGTVCQGVEACCLPDGTCREMDAQCCSGSGLPLGAGSLCQGDSNGDGIDDTCCDVGPGNNVVIDLTTGTLDAGGLIPVNGFDDTWTVISQPAPTGTLPRPAVVVTPSTAWAAALPNSQWISASPGFGVIPGGPPGTYCYESCFCLHDGFHNASLSFSLRADNSAFVYLNNFGCANGGAVPLILTDSPSFNSPNPTTFPATGNVPLVAGENCIEVRVNNANLGGPSATGFNMTGQVTADDARCCCEPLSSGFGCEKVDCLDAREQCIPTLASYDPCDFGAGYTTLSCDCNRPNQCHLVDGPTGPTCVGSCPTLKLCTLRRDDPNGDGIFDYSCACGPPTAEVGDVDHDGDVDLLDHALLQNAFTGPSE